ncbi:helix-turn-helix transcriptional regulator [Glaciecola petra]|uniref:Helix-turn-helix domain-containing protein n=1 Tax=Glaciecola petra TaxID=3075602 RepID=A0ABU2ZNI0_9ALTE|nr:helix-turn-helix domain-containing protein [Aestuariibacter sp. P117]MDT0594181.1 helix-turn-helix domain-containing protein [Aestuariibacter sp. P117]
MKNLPTYYFGHLIALLRERNIDVDSWLLDKKLNEKSLYTLNGKVNLADFEDLMQIALKEDAQKTLGIELGHRLQIAHHGTFGLALLNCENLQQIIDFVAKYLIIRIPFIEVNYIYQGDEIVVLAKDTFWKGELHAFVIEAVTAAMFNLFAAIQARVPDLYIGRIFFDYKQPEFENKYACFESAEITFNHAYCGIATNHKLMHKSIPGVDKLSFLQAEQACQLELEKSLEFTSYAGKVQQILMQTNTYRPKLPEVAKQLNISQRTLDRYLKQEQTSFKRLLDQHQAVQAKEYLLVYGYSISKTSVMLGFLDLANFRRAFKRWYQCSPTEFIEKNST